MISFVMRCEWSQASIDLGEAAVEGRVKFARTNRSRQPGKMCELSVKQESRTEVAGGDQFLKMR